MKPLKPCLPSSFLALLATWRFLLGPVLALCLCAFVVQKSARAITLPWVWKQAVAPYEFHFPRDHAAHPEYQTEWWYYTGHLYQGGQSYGFELTFFQVGINPKRKESQSAWALHTLYFAHFTVTDEQGKSFRFTENVSRPALGMAGSETGRYHVW